METVRELTIGRVTVRIEREYDSDPDYSDLGKFCNFTYPGKWEYLYDRATGDIMGYDHIWRDSRGRFVHSDVDRDNWSREFRYIMVPNNGDALKYHVKDGERLDAFANDQWWYIGLIATVEVDGRDIGTASLWGIESDSDRCFLDATAHELAHEAIQNARSWLGSLVASATDVWVR